jgi:DMSO/TMAO reductase YedYZ molybdopterin-dependent catalytic subunit
MTRVLSDGEDSVAEESTALKHSPPHELGAERRAFIALSPSGFYYRPPPLAHELSSYITPDDSLFQTIHMGAAEVDYSRYQLLIDGLVQSPYTLTLEQLHNLPKTNITAFHECYGSPLQPPTKNPWRIGNVVWSGVRLSLLLELAGGPCTGAKYLWSEGLDRGTFGGVTADRYQKDLPLSKATSAEVIIATHINGEPLSKERGGPARLVVPGWFGTNMTKWVCRLSVREERAKGPYTTRFYNEIDPSDPDGRRTRPVWIVDVNSMITRPQTEAVVEGKRIQIEGWAWSEDGVGNVEVTADNGATWVRAIVHDRFEYGWQRFEYSMELSVGTHTLMSRATSISGKVQPLCGRRNHVHRVLVTIEMKS